MSGPDEARGGETLTRQIAGELDRPPAAAGTAPLAVLFGLAGTELSDDERSFFRSADPLGFNLFKRNCDTPDQVRALVDDLRASVGRSNAPVLIDQEGGRVARLKPPHWRHPPATAAFGDLARRDQAAAEEAVAINYRLIAAELFDLGITINAAPVLDLRRKETTDAIGNRAFCSDPATVAALGLAACGGLMAGGVTPIIKHMPGHGRATTDSHLELPTVEADRRTLMRTDFLPFTALAGMPWGMTAHILYPALDPDLPATHSPAVIETVIRGEIGFSGFLASDDICMEALEGDIGARAARALAAGCDVVLHGDGNLAAMEQVAAGARSLDEMAVQRLLRSEAMRRAPDIPDDIDVKEMVAKLDGLLAPA